MAMTIPTFYEMTSVQNFDMKECGQKDLTSKECEVFNFRV